MKGVSGLGFLKITLAYASLSFIGVLGTACAIPAMAFLFWMGEVRVSLVLLSISTVGMVCLRMLYKCGFASRYYRLQKLYPDPDLVEDGDYKGR